MPNELQGYRRHFLVHDRELVALSGRRGKALCCWLGWTLFYQRACVPHPTAAFFKGAVARSAVLRCAFVRRLLWRFASSVPRIFAEARLAQKRDVTVAVSRSTRSVSNTWIRLSRLIVFSKPIAGSSRLTRLWCRQQGFKRCNNTWVQTFTLLQEL